MALTFERAMRWRWGFLRGGHDGLVFWSRRSLDLATAEWLDLVITLLTKLPDDIERGLMFNVIRPVCCQTLFCMLKVVMD